METNNTLLAPLIGISRHRLATDGEGVTTLVAFHGCPLRCRYCLNPQSLHPDGIWKLYHCEELYEEVNVDALYFLATNGGVTFGGGEPCLHSPFIEAFRMLCGTQWQISIETSLNVPQQHLERLLPVVDRYIVDIKDMNDAIYKSYTNKSNAQVLTNLHWLIEQGKANDLLVRIPQIPSFNTATDREQSLRQLQEMGLSHFHSFTYKT